MLFNPNPWCISCNKWTVLPAVTFVRRFQFFCPCLHHGRVFASRLGVIWFACIWSIWKARNDKLFKYKEVYLENIVESVKRSSWNWLRFKTNSMEYNLNQWFANPRACLGCVELQVWGWGVFCSFGDGSDSDKYHLDRVLEYSAQTGQIQIFYRISNCSSIFISCIIPLCWGSISV